MNHSDSRHSCSHHPCPNCSFFHSSSCGHPHSTQTSPRASHDLSSGNCPPSVSDRNYTPTRLDKYNHFHPSPPRQVDRYIANFNVAHWRQTAHLSLSAEGRAIWLDPKLAPAKPVEADGREEWVKVGKDDRLRDWSVERSKGYAILINSLGAFRDPVLDALGSSEPEPVPGLAVGVSQKAAGQVDTKPTLEPDEDITHRTEKIRYLRDEAPLWKVEEKIVQFFEREKETEKNQAWCTTQ